MLLMLTVMSNEHLQHLRLNIWGLHLQSCSESLFCVIWEKPVKYKLKLKDLHDNLPLFSLAWNLTENILLQSTKMYFSN